jgi:molybdopterin-guanine dinucleotide biosynthesis protein A
VGLIVGILAGGRSERFGGNKLLDTSLGRPIVEIVAQRLRPLGLPLHLIAPPNMVGDYAFLDFPVIPDSYMVGPIGGLLSALRWHDVVLVGGDMPLVSVGLFARMLRVFRRTGMSVVPKLGPYLEPLHAIYSRGLYEALEGYVAGGGRSIQGFLKAHGCFSPYPVSSKRPFFNVNTPDDLRCLQFPTNCF